MAAIRLPHKASRIYRRRGIRLCRWDQDPPPGKLNGYFQWRDRFGDSLVERIGTCIADRPGRDKSASPDAGRRSYLRVRSHGREDARTWSLLGQLLNFPIGAFNP